MNNLGHSDIARIAEIVAVILILAIVQPVQAQQFDDGLIERTRAASRMIPGDLPLEVRFQFHEHARHSSRPFCLIRFGSITTPNGRRPLAHMSTMGVLFVCSGG